MSQQPVVSVRGEAEITVPPETAIVTVSVLARERTRQKAESQLVDLSAAIGRVIARHEPALRRHSASSVSVFPVLRNRKSDKADAYQGRRTWTVEVQDFGALPAILGELIVSDYVTIDGPRWRVETGSPVHQQARTAAVQDAIRRARSYAEAFGATLDQLVEVADVGMSTDGAAAAFAAAAPRGRSAADAPPLEQIDLEPVEQRVLGRIEARFTMTVPDLNALT